MTDPAPAVVLLFDDTELGGQLRAALQARGARIVHEGGVSSISRELLRKLGAEVVVVNLDDAADDALDHLYEVIDSDRPRVVFNDAQASRALAGWDRARWARHLALKVLAVGDVDPPRPEDARAIEVPPAAAPIEAAAEVHAVSAAPEPVSFEQDLPEHAGDDEHHARMATAESENLTAELEALLASDELPGDEEETSGPGLRYTAGEEPPPLHDGHFGEAKAATDEQQPGWVGSTAADEPLVGAPGLKSNAGFKSNVVQLEQRSSASRAETPMAAVSDAIIESIPVGGLSTPVSAPADWALLGDDETPVAAEKSDAAAFGIEKMSAADFLAPDVEQVAPEIKPVLNLELVSMEEAIAPQPYQQQGNEMLLDELGGALNRIVLLGAAVDGTDSVCAFLAALPAATRLTFLHTQHQGGQGAAALVKKLSAHCALPVRLAEHGGMARAGEVLVVSAGQHARLRRDGGIEIAMRTDSTAQDPSIDATFSMAANAFGRDALAIVFAGRANDAVAGTQAIHDRGGQVWVESSSGEHFSDMVSGIFAERLVNFSGTPHELAAHLIEVFP